MHEKRSHKNQPPPPIRIIPYPSTLYQLSLDLSPQTKVLSTLLQNPTLVKIINYPLDALLRGSHRRAMPNKKLAEWEKTNARIERSHKAWRLRMGIPVEVVQLPTAETIDVLDRWKRAKHRCRVLRKQLRAHGLFPKV